MALAAGEPYRVACALAAEAGFSAAPGGRSRRAALALVARARALAEAVGHPNALGFAAFAAGAADYLVGEWKSALRRCDEAEHILRTRCTGVTWWRNSAAFFALECLAYLGDFGELRRRTPGLLENALARGDLYAANMMRTGLASLAWLAAGDVETARRHGESAKAAWVTGTFHIQHLGQLLTDVQIDLYGGDGERAYERVMAAWPAIRSSVVLRIQLTRIATAHEMGRATLAAALTDGRRRDALLARTRRIARRIARESMPWSSPLAQLLHAGADRIAGDDANARARLEAAIPALLAVDMGAYAAAAELGLGRLIGGSEGEAKQAAARARILELGAREPDAMARVLTPGL
jgi:hypothetical protein